MKLIIRVVVVAVLAPLYAAGFITGSLYRGFLVGVAETQRFFEWLAS